MNQRISAIELKYILKFFSGENRKLKMRGLFETNYNQPINNVPWSLGTQYGLTSSVRLDLIYEHNNP